MRGEKSNLNFSYRLMCKMTFRVMLINRHTYEGGFQQEGPQWVENTSCFFLPSSLSYGYPCLLTPWIGVLLDEGDCLLLK